MAAASAICRWHRFRFGCRSAAASVRSLEGGHHRKVAAVAGGKEGGVNVKTPGGLSEPGTRELVSSSRHRTGREHRRRGSYLSCCLIQQQTDKGDPYEHDSRVPIASDGVGN